MGLSAGALTLLVPCITARRCPEAGSGVPNSSILRRQELHAYQDCRLQLASLAKSLNQGSAVFKTGNTKISVPAAVLGLYSDIFDAMFLQSLESEPEVVVPVENVPPAVLVALLRWMLGLCCVEAMGPHLLGDLFR